MIITKTPLRISLVGGGTDLPAFYNNFGSGAVVSFAINKYVYIVVNPRFEKGFRVSYSETENVESLDKIKHALVREALKAMNLDDVEIVSIADIPGKGTGLGSSSSFSVGLILALSQHSRLYHDRGMNYSLQGLAEAACNLEIERCKKPIGKQDQYAAVYGGLNFISFTKDDPELESVTVTRIEQPVALKLQKKLLLFYTGKSRSSGDILSDQTQNLMMDSSKVDKMVQMAYFAERMRDELEEGDISNVGKYLHENWELKRRLSNKITDDEINRWYESGMDAGAEGGKLCGAGGGGFLLFFADESKHEEIKEAIGLRHIPFQIDQRGSRIVYMEGFSDE